MYYDSIIEMNTYEVYASTLHWSRIVRWVCMLYVLYAAPHLSEEYCYYYQYSNHHCMYHIYIYIYVCVCRERFRYVERYRCA